jgi:hypothetical protein
MARPLVKRDAKDDKSKERKEKINRKQKSKMED